MNERTYLEIYDSVGTIEDVERISRETGEPAGVIGAILHQKIVRAVKGRHARIQRNSKKHVSAWKNGDAILSIAQRNRIPATLMASMILIEMGYSKKYVNRMYKNPEMISNRRLRTEITQALKADYSYSPIAHQMQTARGKMGEDIIGKWLEVQDIAHRTETDLRKSGTAKTPDFVLDGALTIDEMDVQWIESKAIFGDTAEHGRYFEKQFKHYEEEYGHGMVVYWYGFLDSIMLDGHVIKNHEFFAGVSDDVEKILDFTGY